MNRRLFAMSMAAVAILPFALVGCDTATVATFVTTIAKYAAQLATYFGQASAAGQITSLAAQIASDIANWQSGGSAADAIEALNDLADLVNLIPITASYVVPIDLILAAIAGLLALLPSAATLTVQMSVKAHTAKLKAQGVTRRVVSPTYYKDFSKKSMTTANDDIQTNWARVTAGLVLTK